MREPTTDHHNVLIVGMSEVPSKADALVCYTARSGREAIEMLRMFSFDLLLIGDCPLTDISSSDLIRKVRKASPWQRWAKYAPHCSKSEEREARSLGVTCIFHTMPTQAALCRLAKAARRVRSDLTLPPAAQPAPTSDSSKTPNSGKDLTHEHCC